MYKVREKIKKLLLTPEKIFVIFSLVFGTLSAFLVPQLSVTDEQMHFLRSYSIATFQPKGTDCQYPQGILEKTAEAEAGNFSTDYLKTISLKPISNPANSELSTSSPSNNSCGSAATYNPFLHIPQAAGIFVVKLFYASPDLMVLAGRLMNVLFYSFFLYFIIKYVKIGKWTILVISLLPSMVHLAGSLSGDVFNNAVVIGFISVVISYAYQKERLSRKQLAILGLLTLALSFTKLPNALLLGLLVLIPSLKIYDYEKLKIPKIEIIRRIFPLTAAFLIFVIGIISWQLIHGPVNIVTAPDNPLIERPWHFLRILFNTYLEPFIGYNNIVIEGVTDFFSSFRYSLPDFVVFISWATLFYTLMIKEPIDKVISNRSALFNATVSFTILSGLVVGITYALYTAWAIQPFRLGPGAHYADGVQGRYFTAFLTLLIPLFIYFKKFTYINIKSPFVISAVVVISTLFVLTFYTLQTYFFTLSI